MNNQTTVTHTNNCTNCVHLGSVNNPSSVVNTFNCNGNVVIQYENDGPDYRNAVSYFAGANPDGYIIELKDSPNS